MTARGMLLVMAVGAALLGALLVSTLILAVGARDRNDRIDLAHDRITMLRERVARDEYAFCRVLAITPDPEQSRQIAALARRLHAYRIAGDAETSATVVRLPPQCPK
jgi:hypothetical protein